MPSKLVYQSPPDTEQTLPKTISVERDGKRQGHRSQKLQNSGNEYISNKALWQKWH